MTHVSRQILPFLSAVAGNSSSFRAALPSVRITEDAPGDASYNHSRALSTHSAVLTAPHSPHTAPSSQPRTLHTQRRPHRPTLSTHSTVLTASHSPHTVPSSQPRTLHTQRCPHSHTLSTQSAVLTASHSPHTAPSSPAAQTCPADTAASGSG